MLGVIGITAILGCVAASVISAVVAAAAIAVSVGVGVSQTQQAREQHEEMKDLQEEQQLKEKARLEAQKILSGKRLERQHIKNMQTMGTGILMQEVATRNTRLKLGRTYSEISASKGKASTANNYNYGKPVQAVANVSQSSQSGEQAEA